VAVTCQYFGVGCGGRTGLAAKPENGGLFSASQQAREIDERANIRSEPTRHKRNANCVEQLSFGDLDDVRGQILKMVFWI
jgi:hypothetical protein